MFNLKIIIMRKLFTFVMAMVITAMAFGQMENLLCPGVIPVQDSQDDRTGWIGGVDDYNTLFSMTAGKRICMRLPACGDLPAGNLSVTKVAFRWQPTNGQPEGSPNLVYYDRGVRILIYAGCNSEWIQGGQNVYRTTDTTVQGTLLHSQDYECIAEGWNTGVMSGWQTVEMSHPVAIPSNQEIWIAIEALGTNAFIIAPDWDKQHPEWWGQHLVFGYNPDSATPENPEGKTWSTVGFNGGNETLATGKFGMKVLIDNEEPYTNTTDWKIGVCSLETLESGGHITRLYVDQYMLEDSLYLYPDIINWGPDTNTADGRLRMYVPGTDVVLYDKRFSQLAPEGVEGFGINTAPSYGWLVSWLDGLMAYSDMERLGLTFPFYVACTFETDGYDPILSNNTVYVKITDRETDDEEPPVLINSNELNTLNISPNPANTHIKVENVAGSQITVYNIAGQEVLSVASAEANETLNVSNLKAGLYIVRVAKGNEVSTAKFSIVR